ncbi:hypothetical protein KSS87_004558 [Heliosperma pusillum]|nr:hypothetical protein KSS87_004558 [Heliosperma pusillum]
MMVVGNKDDLGLTLSLASTPTPTTSNNNHNLGFMMMMNRNNNNNHNHQNHETTPFNTNKQTTSPPLQLNLMMTPPPPPPPPPTVNPFLHKLQRIQSTDSYPPTTDRSAESCRLFLRGIDVNRPAGGAGAEEEDAGVSSPNSTVSTVSGKRSLCERDSTSAGAADDLDIERGSSRGLSDDEDGGDNSRKKLRLTKDQSAILEDSFKEHNTLNPKQKLALAKRLGLRPRQVEVWFQNRRARTKLKQTEVDCEFLKRCCEQLTEENRRLQKEVQELRTLKMSPQFYMQMTPPTTLTMCPSCERVAVPTSGPAQSKPHPSLESRSNIRPVANNNPWVTAAVPIRSFDAIHPRS